MAVPKLEVLAHARFEIIGTAATDTFDIRPTANQTWTIKRLQLFGDLVSNASGSSEFQLDIIDNGGAVDDMPIDVGVQSGSGTLLIDRTYNTTGEVLNMTLSNNSFLRVTLLHIGANTATSFMNISATGVRRIT